MVSLNRYFKRCIPLLLAFVILVGILPAVPASASGVDSSTGEITDTWDEIGQYVASGEYKTRYALGNYKTITLTNGTSVDMQIVAFDVDEKADGSGTAAISWLSIDCIAKRVLNSTNTNANGWAASEMRTWLQSEVLAALPEEVQDAIVSVNKTYYDYTTQSTLTIEDTVWIPSIGEMFGNDYDANGCEDSGAEYTSYFTDSASRIKYYDGFTTFWWLRSTYSKSGKFFRGVNTNGSAGNNLADVSSGVVFGFCTGASAAETYTHTVTIDGEEFTFTSEDASPPVTIKVTEAGCTMTFGSDSTTWTYSGDGVFTGLYSPSQDYLYEVGSYFSLMGGGAADKTSAFTSRFDYKLSAGQWECKSLIMTGEYVDLTAWPDGLTAVDLDFVSGDRQFTSMEYKYSPLLGYCLYYDDDVAYYYDTLSPDPAPYWQMDAFSSVYFAEDQIVSEAFHNWFTSCFTYIGEDQTEAFYTTTINIYDVTGLELLASWSESASGSAPSFTFTVLDNGILVSGAESWTWTEAGESFYGFSLYAGGSAVAYSPGEISSFEGSNADFTLNLYVVSELSEKVYETGVLGWLHRLYDFFVELPNLIRNAIFGEEALTLLDEATAKLESLSVFRMGMRAISAGFGLSDLFEDPTGPFAWLIQ